MKASARPFWAWLLLAAISGFIGVDGFVGVLGHRVSGAFGASCALAFIVIGVLLAIVGIIRFVKWALED